MDPADCAKLLTSFPEDELACILACLTDSRRKELLGELRLLDAHLTECAYDTMRCEHGPVRVDGSGFKISDEA